MTTILLIAYLVVTFIMTNNSAAAATTPADNPVIITIEDGERNRFVTEPEVAHLISGFIPAAGKEPFVISQVNTKQMEDYLNSVVNIEWARCSRTSADRLLVEIVPMKPLARIFDGDSSYYVNAQGKRLTASLRYRSDVPVIQGHLETVAEITRLFPLINAINSRPELKELVTSIRVAENGDAILIPAIKGHVVNFGAPDRDIDNKFKRLLTMYRKVMPVKGWDFYDTLSVKYAHQMVATRRYPKVKEAKYIVDTEGDNIEATVLNQMITSSKVTPAIKEAESQANAEAANPTEAQPAPSPKVDEPMPVISEPDEADEPLIVIEQ